MDERLAVSLAGGPEERGGGGRYWVGVEREREGGGVICVDCDFPFVCSCPLTPSLLVVGCDSLLVGGPNLMSSDTTQLLDGILHRSREGELPPSEALLPPESALQSAEPQ